MIYVLILITSGAYAPSSTGYEFTSLENCQKALAAAEALRDWNIGAYGFCVQK